VYAGCDLSEVVKVVPLVVWLSHRRELGIDRCEAGAPALSNRPAIEGRNRDMMYVAACQRECVLGDSE